MRKEWIGIGLMAVGLSAGATVPGGARMFGNQIADAVEKVMPSIVVIRTESRQDRFVQDWFFGMTYRVPERLVGQGSGVIIRKDGYILTNNHVIDGASEVSVVLNDGTKYAADLVGVEPHTDLAVLKVRTEGGTEFPVIAEGDSDQLRVGEFVIAIGSPFSLASSVTLGIVSQKGRSIGLLPYEDFIQTDAAVNQGNSGGPLVDVDGRMVGVNTVIQTAGMSQGNIGISFAIPANLAMRVAESIIDHGRWERPWIGILMNDEHPDGIEIMEVIQNSPAQIAGLSLGDVITQVDGERVVTARDVQRAVLNRATGEAADLTLLRDGQTIHMTIMTEPMPTTQIYPPRLPPRP
ncbi:MAG: trypsin-like peptidase domain-containing protein [Kiritimatiellae bacterium]|nr:trypsin-like peptidase domain-containing protein [Kiritimatiellia bacterium]